MADITQMSALELLDAYKNDRLTVEQSVSALLSRISDRDGTVRAWVHLDPEQVLVQARQADKIPKSQRGPLHGVPVAIKDVMYTKRESTSSHEMYPADWGRNADTTWVQHLCHGSARAGRRERENASQRWSHNHGQVNNH